MSDIKIYRDSKKKHDYKRIKREQEANGIISLESDSSQDKEIMRDNMTIIQLHFAINIKS